MVNGEPIRILVADDEPIARRGMVELLRAHPGVELVGEASGGRQALDLIAASNPDIVILDVEMPGVDGFAVVSSFPGEDRPELIFVTAHEHFALQGFQVSAIDYVLKPYSAERFHEAVSRAVQRRKDRIAACRYSRVLDVVEQAQAPAPAQTNIPAAGGRFAERLLVQVGARGIVVATSTITLLQADGAFVRVCTAETSYTLRESLQTLETQLDPRAFIRVHRSAMVRIDAVRVVERLPSDRIALVLDGGARVPVSRSRRDIVMERLAHIRG